MLLIDYAAVAVAIVLPLIGRQRMASSHHPVDIVVDAVPVVWPSVLIAIVVEALLRIE